MYNHINIVLATKHKKEEAISEAFKKAFSASIFVPTDYDTDQFGTFTGEVERKGTALETVITKAKQAGITYGYNYAIASEGCFGPHPSFFFVPADMELMAFVDLTNDIVVVESDLSTQTNYGHIDIKISDDYSDFLVKCRFGSHGLIVRSLDSNIILAKGVMEMKQLNELLHIHFQTHTTLRLETDMRAMMNPTRMKVINTLADKLVKRLMNQCKLCNTPGFGHRSTQNKLLCKDCGSETQFHASVNLACVKCDYSENHPREDGLTTAEPMYCQYCNP